MIHSCFLEPSHFVLNFRHAPGQDGIASFRLTTAKAAHQAHHQLFFGFRIVGNEHWHIGRADDLCGVAPDVVTVYVQDMTLVGQGVGSSPNVPVIRIFGHDTQRLFLAATANQQFGMGLLDGFWIEGGLIQLIVFALERGFVPVPEVEQHLTCFIQTIEPFPNRIKGDAIGLVLIALPGSTETAPSKNALLRARNSDHDSGLLEASPADEAAGQGDEGVVEFGAAFPADGETFELVEQGEGLLDDVAELAQALDVRGTLAGDDRQDPALRSSSRLGLES